MKEKKPENKKEISPLEGKYVITNFKEADTDEEINATFLYKIENGKAKSIFGSGNLNVSPREGTEIYVENEMKSMDYEEYFLYLIEKLKIKELYVIEEFKKDSVGNLNKEIEEEFGIDYGFNDLDDPNTDYENKDEINNWIELDSNIRFSVLENLKSLNIKVKSYNLETNQISDY